MTSGAREPDEGTELGRRPHLRGGLTPGRETAAPSYDREASWEQQTGSGNWPASGTEGTGDEWDRVSDDGTRWDGESTHAAGQHSGLQTT